MQWDIIGSTKTVCDTERIVEQATNTSWFNTSTAKLKKFNYFLV